MSEDKKKTPDNTPRKSLAAKLALITAAIDHVEKRGINKFHNYKYVKATDIANAVRQKLAEQNVYLSISTEERRNYDVPAKEGNQLFVDVRLKFTFYDGDSGEQITFYSEGTGGDKGDKGIYKAMTGALKYGLRNAFQIPDESDPEADETLDNAVNQPHRPDETTRVPLPTPQRLSVNGGTSSLSKISEAQAKRLFAKAKTAGWTTEALRGYLSHVWQCDSSTDINQGQYEAICGEVERGPIP